MRILNHAVLISAALVLLACGGPEPTEEDGGTAPDSGLDASVVEIDSGADDAGESDSGHDGGVDLDAHVPDAASGDAGPVDGGPERCSAEGMYRTAACACEGTVSQRCEAGVWTDVTECSATPTCEPAAFETRDGFQCSVQQRVCGDDCQWGEWVEVVEMGECYPGTTVCSMLSGIECRCNAMCQCETWPECPVIP